MEWIAELERITPDYVEAFGGLNSKQLNWKPSADRWSIGQILDHVITTNSTFFPTLEELHAGTFRPHFLSKFAFVVDAFGNLVLGAVQPESKRKVKALPAFEPSYSEIAPDVVRRFQEHQSKLAGEIQRAEYLLDRVVSSPGNRMVVYRLDKAFEILVAHERRHLGQAKEVLVQMSAVTT